jgi:hypothetical protein
VSGVGYGYVSAGAPATGSTTETYPVRWEPDSIFASNATTADQLVTSAYENCGENGWAHTADFEIDSVSVDGVH